MVQVLDTVKTVIENFPCNDSINVAINKIQEWDGIDTLITAVKAIPSTSQTVAQWLTALGTIGTVIAAIGVPEIQKFRNRPIISFSFDFDFKPTQTLSKYIITNSNDEEEEKSIEIFIGVKNTGRTIPKFASTSVPSYFMKTRDDKINEHFIDLINLKTKKKTDKNVYIPNGETLFKVACIKKRKDNSVVAPKQLSTKPAPAQPSTPPTSAPVTPTAAPIQDKYSVYLCDDSDIHLGCGEFIIPIYFTSARATKRTYLKILWAREDWSTEREDFCVEELSEEEFAKMTNAGGNQ